MHHITFLNEMFGYFEENNIPYCVLHSYKELPEKVVSDVDICIDISEKELDEIIWKISSQNRVKVIQKLYYEIPSGFYYVLFLKYFQYLKIDFLNDRIGINRYCLKNNQLLAKTKFYKDFNIPLPEVEFLYLLIKKVIKRQFFSVNQDELRELYKHNPKDIDKLIEKYFGLNGIKYVSELLKKSYEKEKVFFLDKLRKHLFFSQMVSKPWKWLLIIYYQTRRIIHRVKKPAGIFVCMLSPDGGGKSSISKAILERLFGAFRKMKYIHWRPELLPQIRNLLGKSKLENEFVITNPHTPEQRGRITSFVRWMYYTFDYIVGYYLKILPMKIKTTAVVMDRYYYDVIVDPVRYGFNLPEWLLKLPIRFIPKPDLTIYLDNSAEELHKRKQELSVSELKRQVELWREFIPTLPNARIVTTDKPLEDVVNEVAKFILERQAEKTRKILKIEPEASQYLWKSHDTDYVALPFKQNCRWIIPTNSIFAKNAWNLYLPYSVTGKLYKRVFKVASSMELLKFMKSNMLNFELIGDEGNKLRDQLEEIFKRDDFVLAISTGTPGPFGKITALVMTNNGKILGYVKIGETPLAIARVKNEAHILKLLANNYHLSEISYPKCLFDGGIGKSYVMVQSPAPFEGRSGGKYFNNKYLNILKHLINNTAVTKKFTESEFYKNLKIEINNYSLSYKDVLQDGLKYLERSIGDKEITFALSHGDFTPWNMTWDKNEVFIYDWESALLESPAGIDFFHFLFQIGILLKRKRGQELLNYILDLKEYNLFKNSLNMPLLPIKSSLMIYLLKMAVEEDKPQILSMSAVERRRLIKLIVHS